MLHDGWAPTLAPILEPTWRGWFVLFYTVVPVMWLGYLLWGTLLRTYPAGKVGPVSLLVPCCALVFSALLTGESVGGLRLLGVAVVLGGVALGIFASALAALKKKTGAFAPAFPPMRQSVAAKPAQPNCSPNGDRCIVDVVRRQSAMSMRLSFSEFSAKPLKVHTIRQ